MVYRIRYSDQGGARQAEAVVEAASPTEALVKFCHVGDHCQDPDKVRDRVLSASAEGGADEAPWPLAM